MGQYYKPYLVDDNGKFMTFYSHDYGNGLKLMEHSYLGNDFVNAVLTIIEDYPMRVGWIGDYSDSAGVDDYIYEICWRSNDMYDVKIEPKAFMWDGKDSFGEGYYVNHDKKQFIDLEKYAPHAEDCVGYKVNPLPLLTAIGNGLGGGDYHSCYQNYAKVGDWYMDKIEFVHELSEEAEKYDDVTMDYIFKEER